jgi:soluble lytic murein transglycosylase-like protein
MTYLKAFIFVVSLAAATSTAFGPSGLITRPAPTTAARPASPAGIERAAAVRREIEQQNAEVTARLEAAERHLAALQRIAPIVPPRYREAVLEAAAHNDLDPLDLAAVGYVESRWDCTAKGSAGEVGCLQLLPSTAAQVARHVGLTTYDLADPSTNIALGAAYLRMQVTAEGGIDRALAAYNGGPAAMERKPLSARAYLGRVRAAQAKG